MLNGLDLFSGIGGIGLALSEWVRTVAYCEQDRYAQGVLLSRMQSGDIDRAPIWNDVRTLRKHHLPEIDIIFGGFPCQDISCAGSGVGLMAGERSGLYFEIARLIGETNPRFVFLENVPAIRTRGLNAVVQSLTELGYDCRWTIVSAAEVGAPHLRKRWFLLAHANGTKLRLESDRLTRLREKALASGEGRERNVTRAYGERLEGHRRHKSKVTQPSRYGEWLSEPSLCRGDNGLLNRVERLKCLGNSVVPMQAKAAFERLMGLV